MFGKMFETRAKRLARLEREAVAAWDADARRGPAPDLRLRSLAIETAAKFALTHVVVTRVESEGVARGLPDAFARVLLCNPTEHAIEHIGRQTMALPHVESVWGEIGSIVSQLVFSADKPALFVVREPKPDAVRIARDVLADSSQRHALILDRTALFAGPSGTPDFADLESLASPAKAKVEDVDGLVRIAPKHRS